MLTIMKPIWWVLGITARTLYVGAYGVSLVALAALTNIFCILFLPWVYSEFVKGWRNLFPEPIS